MKYFKFLAIALVIFGLIAPRAEARGGRGGAFLLGAAVGAIAVSASRPDPYYRPYYCEPAYVHRYYAPYRRVPATGGPMIPGAWSAVDEGPYRNYRDAYGNYLGRVPLDCIPPWRW